MDGEYFYATEKSSQRSKIDSFYAHLEIVEFQNQKDGMMAGFMKMSMCQ